MRSCLRVHSGQIWYHHWWLTYLRLMEDAIRLSRLMDQLKRVVSLNFPSSCWMLAEIAQSGQNRGHIYMQLVEKDEEGEQLLAQASAVMWGNRKTAIDQRLGSDCLAMLQPGHSLRLLVKVDFHPVYGLKLVVEDVDLQFILGQMALRRRQMVDYLKSKGLLDLNRQRPMPAVLQRIAVITSPQAAGWQDFRQQLDTNPAGYRFHLTLFPAAMQGEAVETEVCRALESIAVRAHEFDVAVLIRGGGSKTDLAWFDNQRIGESMAMMPLPVLTGIGHDVDETIADLVAWHSLKTPTAVAVWILEHQVAFESSLLELARQIREAARHRLSDESFRIHELTLRLHHNGRQRVEKEKWKMAQIKGQLVQGIQVHLTRAGDRLDHAESLIRQMDPASQFARGYSMTLYQGRPLTDAAILAQGALLETVVAKGRITSRVEHYET